MEPLKVSILIPCYNASNFLPELFKGIENQTVPFSEVICYDDCSQDDTINIAKTLGAKVIIGTINRGAAFARNALIKATSCDFIHFHDADDLIDVTFNARMQAEFLKYQKHIDVLLCNTNVLDRSDRLKSYGSITYNELRISDLDTIEYFINNIGFPSMGIYKKNIVEKIGGFNDELRGNEDPDFHIRLANAGAQFSSISDFLVTKLESPQSFSALNWDRCMSDKLKCLETYIIILDKKYHGLIADEVVKLLSYFSKRKNFQQVKFAWHLLKMLNPDIISISPKSKKYSKLLGPKNAVIVLAIQQYIKSFYSR